MHKRNTLFISLIIILMTSCGGGGGSSSSENIQASSVTPAPTPTPPSTIVTSNLIAQAKGTINGGMTYKEIDREFILYVPSSYDSSSKQPLVFNFHGYGSNANEQMNYGDLQSQADQWFYIGSS